ncbi:MAG: hypothetical protein IJK78_10250, partial [Bacteroidales bacterium]|nr:hypothetical protein [Bacteroidales bacterium]
TLRCSIVLLVSVLNLGFRLDVLFGVPLLKGSLPRAAPAALVLCWPQTFKELRFRLPSLRPRFPSESGCKSTTFSQTGKHFFHLFFIFSLSH